MIGKLSKGQSCFKAGLYRILGHHIANRNVFPHIPYKIQEAEGTHPVVVVDQFCCVLPAVKIQEFHQLLLKPFLVMADGFLVQKVPLL